MNVGARGGDLSGVNGCITALPPALLQARALRHWQIWMPWFLLYVKTDSGGEGGVISHTQRVNTVHFFHDVRAAEKVYAAAVNELKYWKSWHNIAHLKFRDFYFFLFIQRILFSFVKLDKNVFSRLEWCREICPTLAPLVVIVGIVDRWPCVYSMKLRRKCLVLETRVILHTDLFCYIRMFLVQCSFLWTF